MGWFSNRANKVDKLNAFALDDSQPLSKRAFGEQLEKLAISELSRQGLKIIAQNYLCKLGEIDIIARDKNDLVFVEVRYRKNQNFGGAVASVNKKKQERVVRAANHYLQKHKLNNNIACRFDVIAISGQAHNLTFDWIKAAFYAA